MYACTCIASGVLVHGCVQACRMGNMVRKAVRSLTRRLTLRFGSLLPLPSAPYIPSAPSIPSALSSTAVHVLPYSFCCSCLMHLVGSASCSGRRFVSALHSNVAPSQPFALVPSRLCTPSLYTCPALPAVRASIKCHQHSPSLLAPLPPAPCLAHTWSALLAPQAGAWCTLQRRNKQYQR